MQKPCPKCGEECTGEDLGDHPCWLTFDCECGHTWGENVMGEMIDEVRMRYKDEGFPYGKTKL